jgi:hypothetical protein
MNIELEFIDKEHYLFVRCKGEFIMDEVYQGLGRVKQATDTLGHHRLLIDAYEISPPKKEFERFLLGKAIAELFPAPYKIAILFKEEFIDNVSQMTAVSKGALYLICGDKKECLEWLLDDDPIKKSSKL